MKPKRNPAVFAQACSDIEELKVSSQAGLIDLYFFDESGFSLQPVVPYAWQLKGQTIEVVATRSQYLSVMGFLNVEQPLIFCGRREH